MADPQQTTPIPTHNQQASQTPIPEGDFFGGGEDAFKTAAVIPNTSDAPVPETPTFVPEEPVWEPTLPPEPTTGWEVGGWEVEGWIVPEEKVEPMPEAKEKEELLEPIPEIEEQIEEKPEEKIEEEILSVGEKTLEPVTVEEKEPIDAANYSDLGKKLLELFNLSQHISELKKTDEGFQLVWADNDTLQILYTFVLGDPEFPMVSVTKVETDKTTEEETTHELSFYLNEAGTSLNVNLDDELLFDEDVDLKDDIKKKMQVMEKLNKFIFLVTEESKKLEKELKEKEAEEQEKRKLQDIFRNF